METVIVSILLGYVVLIGKEDIDWYYTEDDLDWWELYLYCHKN